MVPTCKTIADVGCDHGYLSIALLENGIAESAIAMDVNKGPLESAKSNLMAAGLSDKASFRLSDGLARLDVNEADVICICGMGGALIRRILDARPEVAKSASYLILEPQSEYRQLREFLVSNHFMILDEMLCTEEGKIYPIMKLSYDADSKTYLKDYELEYGPIIIKKSPELLTKLLQKNKAEFKSILDKLNSMESASITDPIIKRKVTLQEELRLIQQVELDMEGKSHGKSNH